MTQSDESENIVRTASHSEFYYNLMRVRKTKLVRSIVASEGIGGFSKYSRQEIVDFFKYISPEDVKEICYYLNRKPSIQVAKEYLDFSDIKGMEKEIEKIFSEREEEYDGVEFRDINFLDLNMYNEEEDGTYYATGANADLNGPYENYGTCSENESEEESEEGISGFCPDCRIDMDGEKHGLPFCTDCGMIKWKDGSYSHR